VAGNAPDGQAAALVGAAEAGALVQVNSVRARLAVARTRPPAQVPRARHVAVARARSASITTRSRGTIPVVAAGTSTWAGAPAKLASQPDHAPVSVSSQPTWLTMCSPSAVIKMWGRGLVG
jgi:hypothetical protein